MILFSLFFLLAFLRLVDLQIIHARFYQEKSQEQRMRIIPLSSLRGDIYDRFGQVLASTVDSYSVFTQKQGFQWLVRKVSREEAESLRGQNPEEYLVVKEKKRVYPKAHLASQLLGFVGSDNQGLSGIELAYEKYLRGKEGKIITEGDPSGKELYGAGREIQPAEEGLNITLTIDSNLQYFVEKELERQIKKFQAEAGMLIIMQAKTGEILALASKPDFDPNAFNKFDKKLWHPRFLDPYEPGSTFKVITTASGLEEKVVDLNTKLKALDQIEIGGKIIKNSHAVHWPGKEISLSFMLEESINTGAVQVGLRLGPERFYKYIRNFGFGEETGFGLNGESRGIVRHFKSWYKPDIAMISFGQSIAVTPLQLLQAFSAFANNGKMVKPYLVKKIESRDGKFVKVILPEEKGPVVSKGTVAKVKELLENVVLKGTGRRAQMENFRVGGKTGTAQKAALGGRGYLKDNYVASFIGLAPLTDPQLIGLVIIDNPKGVIWGETVCGPIFKTAVEFALRYLNIPPDML
jgi:stage V sporulation protein D (sporulation-specific penicillin-binding protein)